jgi:hypothetical protein
VMLIIVESFGRAGENEAERPRTRRKERTSADPKQSAGAGV